MAGEVRSRGNGLNDVCNLFGFLHSDFPSNISHSEAAQCVEALCERFPELFMPELVDEIIAFEVLYFHVTAGSKDSSSNKP